jgi:predicted nuclease with RNAse H fold
MRAVSANVFSEDEILAWISAARPLTVGIDAPLTLPPGRRSVEEDTGVHNATDMASLISSGQAD